MKSTLGKLCLLCLAGLSLCGLISCTQSPSVPLTTADFAPTAPPVEEEPLPADGYRCTVLDEANHREWGAAEDGDLWTFYLPGQSAEPQLTLHCRLGSDVRLQIGKEVYTDSVDFRLDPATRPDLEITVWEADGSDRRIRCKFLTASAGILCLNIDEDLGSIAKMHGDPDHETACYGKLTYVGQAPGDSFSSPFSVTGRGNATWGDPKKGYTVKLYSDTTYAQKQKHSFGGLGNSDSWALLSNYRDCTLIRNALAQTLAAQLGMPSAVGYTYADLYLNGEYRGLYMISEKVQFGKEFVDVPKAKTDSLSGGYLLEFDNYSDSPQIKLKKSGQKVTVKSPDDLAGYTAIANLLNEAEEAIFSKTGVHPQTGKRWDQYIDQESFAILWLVREYTMDYDATVNFRFYYDPSDGKFHAGPAWDFDNSMARSKGEMADPTQTLIESGYRNSSCWLTKLMQHKPFVQQIVKLYNANRALFTTDSPQSVYAMAERYAKELAYSIDQNFVLWEDRLTDSKWNAPDERTYEGHLSIVQEFLAARNAFWQEYIPGLAK